MIKAAVKARPRRAYESRILLKADVSLNGPGWSDSVAEALETSHPTVVRTRRLIVAEGLDAASSRKREYAWPPASDSLMAWQRQS